MLFYRKKIERMIEIQREKNATRYPKGSFNEEEEINLGFKDYLAVIISAFIVFGPIFLVLISIILWAAFTM